MRALSIILWITATWVVPVGAQNLVINGGFESLSTCELEQGAIQYAEGWSNLYAWGPGADLFSPCSVDPLMSAPTSTFHHLEAFEGSNYAGFIPFSGFESPVGSLSNLLDKDTIYYVEFSLSLLAGCRYSVFGLGLVFLDTIVSGLSQDQYTAFNPDVKDTTFISLTGDWKTIKGLYVANGNETCFAIGLFDTLIYQTTEGDFSAYYFLDNVIVRKATPDEINSVRENRLGLQLAPSPTAGPLTIEAKARLREAWVMDMSGRRLWPMQGSGTRWNTDLSGLAAGVYLVEAVAEDGRRAVQKAVLMSN